MYDNCLSYSRSVHPYRYRIIYFVSLLISLSGAQCLAGDPVVIDASTVIDVGSAILHQELVVVDGIAPPTVVDFLTSSGGNIEVRDTSQVNVRFGSQIGSPRVFDEGTLNLINGSVDDDLNVSDFGHVNIFEDGVVDEKLKINGSATVNIYGGVMEGVFVTGPDNASTVNVRGGALGELIFEGNATVNFFGSDFELSDHHLTGVLSDGQVVNSVVTVNDNPRIVFHAVPEPATAATVVLACFGLCFVSGGCRPHARRRFRRRTKHRNAHKDTEVLNVADSGGGEKEDY